MRLRSNQIFRIALLLILSAFAASVQAQQTPTTRPAVHRRQEAIVPPLNPDLPTLWIIGDSTVCNGQDRGENGQWGWANPIAHYFDQTKINVVDFALGGTSSRSFQESIRWPRVLGAMKPGDYLIMQFGHNDGRGVLNGDGDNSVTEAAGTIEHSHGWYMRKYVTDAKAKRAKETIICSLIPRNNWRDGKMDANQKYPQWDADAANQVDATFIDLHKMAEEKYEAIGQDKVTATYFPERETTHTDWAGAIFNAQTVIEGLQQSRSELVGFLLATPPTDLPVPSTGKAR